jgi:hypothetical protein
MKLKHIILILYIIWMLITISFPIFNYEKASLIMSNEMGANTFYEIIFLWGGFIGLTSIIMFFITFIITYWDKKLL